MFTEDFTNGSTLHTWERFKDLFQPMTGDLKTRLRNKFSKTSLDDFKNTQKTGLVSYNYWEVTYKNWSYYWWYANNEPNNVQPTWIIQEYHWKIEEKVGDYIYSLIIKIFKGEIIWQVQYNECAIQQKRRKRIREGILCAVHIS